MTAQNSATLKSYFNTGDTPTEAEFADLVDTVFDRAAGTHTHTLAQISDAGTAAAAATGDFATAAQGTKADSAVQPGSLSAAATSGELADLDTAVTGAELDAIKTKVDGVETGATGDQTGAEIVAAIDTELGSAAWQDGGGGGSYTDEQAQDAIGGILSASFTYTDATPEIALSAGVLASLALADDAVQPEDLGEQLTDPGAIGILVFDGTTTGWFAPAAETPVAPALSDLLLGMSDPGGTPALAMFTPAGILAAGGITLADGMIELTGPSLAGSDAFGAVSIEQTWNTTGAPTTLLVNVTDTASGSAAKLLDIQKNGTSEFAITKDGHIIVPAFNKYGPSVSDQWFQFSSGNIEFKTYNNQGLAVQTNNFLGWDDTRIWRDGAANIIALRNGANAQTLRWAHTWTNASNWQGGALKTAAGYVELAAETAGTGADDVDVLLTPAGAGLVRFGTHTGIAAETITGYITIKDAGGTERKVAVVS